MEAHLRAALAYIAGRLVSGKNSPGVHDHSRSMLVIMNGTAKGSVVAIFDHDRKCHISGSGNGSQYFLFHHGECRAISLTLKGNDSADTITTVYVFQRNRAGKLSLAVRACNVQNVQLLAG